MGLGGWVGGGGGECREYLKKKKQIKKDGGIFGEKQKKI